MGDLPVVYCLLMLTALAATTLGLGGIFLLAKSATRAASARDLEKSWRMAHALGLSVSGPYLLGTLGTMTVRIKKVARSIGIDLTGPGLPDTILLGAEDTVPTNGFAKAVSTGDEEFDRAFAPLGPEEVIRACLDHTTRGELLALSREVEIRLESGHLVASIPFHDVDRVVDTVRRIAAVGERFRRPSHIHTLPEIVASDSVPGVRLSCLQLMLERDPDHEASQRACRVAARDEDPRICFLARACLHGARTQLVGRGPKALFELLRAVPYRSAALAVPSLASLEGAGEVIAAVRELVRATNEGSPLERLLLLSLAKCGSIELVPRLHEHYDGRDPRWRAAAEATIAAIQARASGAGAGQLSVSLDDKGGLSMAAAPGNLSVVKSGL